MSTSNPPYVAIMAGGVGSRFWPASRTARPKQFLDILGVGRSLLQSTYDRFRQITPADHIFIVTNSQYKELVKEQLPYLTDNQILCEPSRNNTAPCVAYTALKLHHLDADANIIVAPSDHIVLKEHAFLDASQKALQFTARENAILTLGISPTRPDTGYGYIKYDTANAAGVHPVLKFAEKPDLATAQTYLDSGQYLWNAGIFIFRADAILDAFRILAPDIYDILAGGEAVYNTPGEQAFIDRAYPTTRSISIDFAIMEKANNVYTIPADIGWSDLGTWASLHAESPKDENGNVVQTDQSLLDQVTDCMIRTRAGKLVVIRDLSGYIVVDEDDVLMIYPKDKEQDIKAVTKAVEGKTGEKFL